MVTAFKTPWFTIEAQPPETADQAPYYILHAPDGVIILPVCDDGRFLMVEQFRPARGQRSLEFPAGQIDSEETPDAAARRELAEETGWTAKNLYPLGTGGLGLNRESAKQHFFLATGLKPLPDQTVEDGITTHLCSAEQLRLKTQSGEFEQSAALGALVMAAWDPRLFAKLPKGLFHA